MSDLDGVNTELLLRQAGEGDLRARAALLEHFRERLRRMIAIRLDKRLAARMDASDVVQEALKDAHRRLPDYFADPQLSFYPWLRRIASDKLIDVYRTHVSAQRRSVLREQPWPLDLNDNSVDELAKSIATSSINPGRRAIAAETESHVKAALMLLKPNDREVLVLRYLEHLTVEEIAAVLEITQDAVTSRHLRALQRLRQYLDDDLGD